MSAFLGTEETILFSSCFDANGGIFEPLLDAECALITDQLITHPSSTGRGCARRSG
jgi:glycine C-acetyltransferase